MGEEGQRLSRVFPWQNYQLDFFSELAGCEVAPGAKLLQPGPTEYMRDKIDLSQSGLERADDDSKQRASCLCVWMVIFL